MRIKLGLLTCLAIGILLVVVVMPFSILPVDAQDTSQATDTASGEEIARPSNPGDAGSAVDLTGDAEAGAQIFVDNCQKCHGEAGQSGVDNPGSDDGTVPPLNPIDETLIDSDPHTYATNLDLFIEHGSTPEGDSPQQTMPAWGDEGKLTPQQIADAIAYIMSLNPAPAAAEIARPSNPGDAGSAVDLTGDAEAGAQIFVDNCQKCHGEAGQSGVDNPGSDDGTVPPLNPIDETLIDSDPHTYATNLDLFIEHGSTPEGDSPQQTMPAWGDEGKLTPQQIADAIAYIMSLNPAPAAAEIARPSNPGDAGSAVDLTGDAEAGAQIFVDNCQKCHGEAGQSGVDNPGSDDGTVPPLNPIDETLIDSDPHTYATNLDLFIEHGSTPEGDSPQQTMPAWGDEGKLTPQQIADAIAYIMSLNQE